MQIEECVQYVFLQEEYVSLPGIGSFVRKHSPAYIDPHHTLHPSGYNIYFSTERQFDDGALLSYLTRRSSLTHEEIEHIYQQWLSYTKHQLSLGQHIFFQGIGSLYQEGNRILLQPENTDLPLTQSYLPLLPLPRAKGIKKRKTRRTNLWVVGTISLTIACTSILLTYYLVDPPTPPTPKLRITLPPLPIADSNVSIHTDTLSHRAEDSLFTEQENPQQILDSSHRQVNALRLAEETPKIPVTYYIVAGSFSNLDNARRVQKELTQKGYRSEIYQIKNKYRVTLGKFYDKKTGVREMYKRRTELQNTSYWLLESNTPNAKPI